VYSIDEEADVLGTVAGSSRPGLVRKWIGGACSILSSAPCLPADLLRDIFATAGCRIHARGGEVVYANKSFLSVSGLPGRTIRLNTTDSCLYDLFSEAEHQSVNGAVELPGSGTGVWVFFRGRKNEWIAGEKTGR
jgi:hypothetical protein